VIIVICFELFILIKKHLYLNLKDFQFFCKSCSFSW